MKRYTSLLASVMLICLLIGCAGIGGDDPNELLSQAVSGIMGKDDFAFEGTTRMNISDARLQQEFAFTGMVSGHNEIMIEPMTADSPLADNVDKNFVGMNADGMLHYTKANKKWTIDNGSDKQLNPMYTLNPVIQLEHLNRASKKVKVDAEQTTNDVTVLHAAVAEEDVLDSFKDHILSEHNEIIASAEDAARSAGNEQMEAELQQFVQDAERQLDEILSSLHIQEDYRLSLHKRSRQLNELLYTAQLQYELDGSSRTETIETTYRFRDSDTK